MAKKESKELLFYLPTGYDWRTGDRGRERCHAIIMDELPKEATRAEYIGRLKYHKDYDIYRLYLNKKMTFDPFDFAAIKNNKGNKNESIKRK